jgi:2-oxoglutarate ferredoxin oxidoreductase subunit beta
VELLQNCNIFNDGAWDQLVDKQVREERCLFLEAGKPMVFAGGKKGIRIRGFTPEVIELGNGLSADDCVVHDPSDIGLANILARMDYPAFPVPMGVIYAVQRPTYDAQFVEQVQAAKAANPAPDLQKLLDGPETWKVE